MSTTASIVGMNSVQLSQRLGRNLNVPDPFNLPAPAALDVLSAINGGLNEFYRSMPPAYKRTTLSHTIRAPRTVSMTFQAQYSRLVGEDTFVLRDQGCTVRFAEGSADNVVTGPNSLLDNYLGTTLAVSGTLYSDAVPIQDVIEQIVGNVRLYDSTQNAPTILTVDERLRGGGISRRSSVGNAGEFYYPADSISLGSIGRPRYYYLDPMGVSQGAEPEFLLRVAPFPDIDYTIRLEAELSTQRLVFDDLATARVINVGAAYLDDILIPLCEAQLVTSPYWRDKSDKDRIVSKAQRIKAGEMPKIPSNLSPQYNRVGTPAGW